MNQQKKQFVKPEMNVEELQQALFQANKKLMESEQKRTELFANISHDLRSPLTAIQTTLEWILGSPEMGADEIREHLKALAGRAAQMKLLVDDVFLLTKLDHGKQEMHLQKVELGVYLEEIFFRYEADPSFAERELTLEVPIDLHANVWMDPDQFGRVMDNLFQNARKYSGRNDRITLRAECKNHEAVFCLEDTGIGMTRENCTRVFERTYTVSSARTPGESGCGLGLSIAKSIVNLHGGRIWCTSEEGQGSRFYVALPIATE